MPHLVELCVVQAKSVVDQLLRCRNLKEVIEVLIHQSFLEGRRGAEVRTQDVRGRPRVVLGSEYHDICFERFVPCSLLFEFAIFVNAHEILRLVLYLFKQNVLLQDYLELHEFLEERQRFGAENQFHICLGSGVFELFLRVEAVFYFHDFKFV